MAVKQGTYGTTVLCVPCAAGGRRVSTHCRKKDMSDTPTTTRSRRLKAFLQKEPECRNAP